MKFVFHAGDEITMPVSNESINIEDMEDKTMNLQKLFNMQKQLDDHIMDEHPELKGQNNLEWKILALLVELGECANEWRGFKKWSNDQEPRTKGDWICSTGIENGRFIDVYENPLLEEYVDCLHFILSIGNEVNMIDDVSRNAGYTEKENVSKERIIRQFNDTLYFVSQIPLNQEDYYDAAMEFLDLGEMLGFTWDQIEQAYLDKNKINHKRQNNGY